MLQEILVKLVGVLNHNYIITQTTFCVFIYNKFYSWKLELRSMRQKIRFLNNKKIYTFLIYYATKRICYIFLKY